MENNSSEHRPHSAALLNQLRAAVLGANDGIVSVSSVVMGVAGATDSKLAIITAGLAALVAGALSMAVGEYVSVSSQSDAEKAYIEREKKMLVNDPASQLEQLADAYIDRGVSPETARIVARELTAKDALKAHLQVQFNLDEDDINSPSGAAVASLLAFSAGGLIPFLAIVLTPESWAISATVVAVLVALFITGYLSASVGNASRTKAVIRVLIGGAVTMAVTYAVGSLFGATID